MADPIVIDVRHTESGGDAVAATIDKVADSVDRATGELTKYESAADGASKETRTLGERTDETTSAVKDAAQATKANAAQMISAAGAAVQLTKEAIALGGALWDAAKSGAEANTVLASFEAMGGTARQMERLKAASSGIFTETDLQKWALQADAIGLTAGELENLTRFVVTSADRTGQLGDAASILTDVLKGSAEAADRLGVRIDTSSGAFVGLSEAGKKTQVALELAARGSDMSAEALDSQSARIAQAEAGFGDLRSSAEQYFADLAANEDVQAAAKDAITALAGALRDTREAVIFLADAYSDLEISQGSSIGDDVLAAFGIGLDSFTDKIRESTDAVKVHRDIVWEMHLALRGVGRISDDVAIAEVKEAAAIRETTKAREEQALAFIEAGLQAQAELERIQAAQQAAAEASTKRRSGGGGDSGPGEFWGAASTQVADELSASLVLWEDFTEATNDLADRRAKALEDESQRRGAVMKAMVSDAIGGTKAIFANTVKYLGDTERARKEDAKLQSQIANGAMDAGMKIAEAGGASTAVLGWLGVLRNTALLAESIATGDIPGAIAAGGAIAAWGAAKIAGESASGGRASTSTGAATAASGSTGQTALSSPVNADTERQAASTTNIYVTSLDPATAAEYIGESLSKAVEWGTGAGVPSSAITDSQRRGW